MNFNKVIAICALLMGAGILKAQPTIYDANRWIGSDLNGTARFIGTGGAMGALGGDITTMGTNPAGIGIYRSNDVMISFGFDNTGTSANEVKQDKFHGSFDNAGIVFSTKIGNVTTVRYANFGFNYRKMKSFNRGMLMSGAFAHSQTTQMAHMLNAGNTVPVEELRKGDAYLNSNLPWLGIMGFNAYLVNPIDVNGNYYDPDAATKQQLREYRPYSQDVGDNIGQSYSSKESGGVHSFDVNGSLNLLDRLYIGATLGLYSVNYDKSSAYSEDFIENGIVQGGYLLGNNFRVDGNGVDFKLGIIARPFEFSSFRIGAAVHTPTYFNLTERNSAYINYSNIRNFLKQNLVTGTSKIYDDREYDMEGEAQYKMVTPWKFNVSLGYTIGSTVALGAEYEFANYSTAKLKNPDGYELLETDFIKESMKPVHAIRVGAEFKLAPEFAFRVGYNHITAPLKADAYKALSITTQRTDTEFSNPGATNNYTLGFGYRGESFYVDMAYLYNAYNETFYAFENVDLPGTKVKNNNHKVAVTLGMRF